MLEEIGQSQSVLPLLHPVLEELNSDGFLKKNKAHLSKYLVNTIKALKSAQKCPRQLDYTGGPTILIWVPGHHDG